MRTELTPNDLLKCLRELDGGYSRLQFVPFGSAVRFAGRSAGLILLDEGEERAVYVRRTNSGHEISMSDDMADESLLAGDIVKCASPSA